MLGVIATCGSFLFAAPNGKFVVTTGLLVIGAVEIGRGIYYLIKASQLSQSADDNEEDEGEDDDEE